MPLREILACDKVLEDCQEAIGEILISGHSSFERLFSGPDTRSEHHIKKAVSNEIYKITYQFRIVLVVRMEHYDYIRVMFESYSVAGLLISSVSSIHIMAI